MRLPRANCQQKRGQGGLKCDECLAARGKRAKCVISPSTSIATAMALFSDPKPPHGTSKLMKRGRTRLCREKAWESDEMKRRSFGID